MKPSSRKRPNARTVRSLSNQAAQAAAQAPDTLADLSASIKAALHSEADPYVMLGVLLEGVTQTLIVRVPSERHRSTVAAALVMLRERLAAGGSMPGQSAPCYQHPTCS